MCYTGYRIPVLVNTTQTNIQHANSAARPRVPAFHMALENNTGNAVYMIYSIAAN